VLLISCFGLVLSLSSCVTSQNKDSPTPTGSEQKPTQVEPSVAPSSKIEQPKAEQGEASPADPVLFRGPPTPTSEAAKGIVSDPESGCHFEGPIDGELLGKALGAETHFDVAVALCLKAGDACTGVTSEWYVGFPWVAIGEAQHFRPDGMSYARTFFRRCPTPAEGTSD
jgi:hypothetical protein